MPPLAPLALTMGDPAGIGPDITLAAWIGRAGAGIPPFAVYADPAVLVDRATRLRLDVAIVAVASLAEASDVFEKALPVMTVATCRPVKPGTPSPANAASTLASIDAATAAVQSGSARALVTNPIAKSVLYAAGFAHPGHTEYLAHLARLAEPGLDVTAVMMLASPELRVVPVTIHIPLADVPGTLSPGLLKQTIEITAAALRRDFGIAQPRIAVCGLNPHAGEGGTIGTEDRDLIAPVIAELAATGLHVTGPHSADTLFHAAARARYDVAIAMYHDQALIPIKTLAFDTGVNITLGLPFVRTSPDHGTAFDIAGTGRASPESLIQAITMAEAMSTARANHPPK
jgi:4-hydroxythreonine-4-phosphate dehydrogenase